MLFLTEAASKDIAAGRLEKYKILPLLRDGGCNQERTENIQQVASGWAISVFVHLSFSFLVSSSRFRLFCQVLTRFSTLGVSQNVQGFLGWGILNPLQCHSTDSTALARVTPPLPFSIIRLLWLRAEAIRLILL